MLPHVWRRFALMTSPAVLILAPWGGAHPQTIAAKPGFDVVSIKPNQSMAHWSSVAPVKNGRFSARNITARQILSEAYHIDGFLINGAPKWLAMEHFDIEARTEMPPPDKDFPLLLQSLLEDRFQLKAHRDKKESAVFALVVGRNGPKFSTAEHRDCLPGAKPTPGCLGMRFAGRGFTAEYTTMPSLARALSQMMEAPVLDETGLKEAYDFKLEWIPEAPETAAAPEGIPVAGQAGIAIDWIFAALSQQLGLKLERRKAPVDVLVIDHIEKPSAN